MMALMKDLGDLRAPIEARKRILVEWWCMKVGAATRGVIRVAVVTKEGHLVCMKPSSRI
jgi:hypothetical protein